METRLESGQDLKNAAREGAQQAADATREAAGRFSAAMQSAKTSLQEKSAAAPVRPIAPFDSTRMNRLALRLASAC